jgi:hypothetical protein
MIIIHIIVVLIGLWCVYSRIQGLFEVMQMDDEEIDELPTFIVNSATIIYLLYLILDYTMRYLL